jgi:tRNA pseudouridine38-40 synthase
MERYKVTLAYDGTQFFGFQRQGRLRTVQLEVEAALRKLGWQDRAILSSGRTDRGVHAAGQVIAFDLEWAHSPQDLGRALNASLPEDVAVKAVEIAAPGFHPRFDASARCYTYRLWFAPERDPLRDRYAWRVWPPCDAQILPDAARLLPGVHDFAAFGAPTRVGGSTIRDVLQAGWQADGEDGTWSFQVTANAFLYHMVRRMVFVQVLAGQQRLSLEALRSAVEQAAPLAPGLAPPQGLVLTAVQYADTVSAGRQVAKEPRNTLQ